MNGSNNEYSQPEKRDARTFVLCHAVDSLTTTRSSSPLATTEDFDRLLQYCIEAYHHHFEDNLSEPLALIRDRWHALQSSRVGIKRPHDLKVLYLCGPDPLNDLREFQQLGIPAENIWAVEGDAASCKLAESQLLQANQVIKLHHGSLSEFFEIVPEQFDIVYFDACGPLFGGKPKTSGVLRELFMKQRMSPLSVLITNFSATPRDSEDTWVRRLYAWYAARYSQPIEGNIDGADSVERIYEPHEYLRHIKKYLEEYYSDFVTRFTIEFVNELLPWWRVRALPSARRAYFSSEQKLNNAIERAFAISDATSVEEIIQTTGHSQLAPDCYPFLWMVKLVNRELDPNDALRELVTCDTLKKAKLCDGINAISLVRNFFEGQIDWAKHNLDACSDELRIVLENCRWFDSPGMPLYGLYCDTPYPNLIIDLIVGVYGYPYHVNMEKLRRVEYRAKQTTMYTDVFILDQCRYLYDLVPTVSMFGESLPIDRQFQIRLCMNLIWRHVHGLSGDLYRSSALASISEEGLSVFDWPKRSMVPSA